MEYQRCIDQVHRLPSQQDFSQQKVTMVARPRLENRTSRQSGGTSSHHSPADGPQICNCACSSLVCALTLDAAIRQ
ncbi:hypothetical protein LCGC14_1865890 [marine sediment metagenome]|uniref:Uncharacterized protein n=1 Tax=marine sediment metagenome TaxID=412755 RepID=A0A0F9J549_9ZZZZ